MRTATLFQLTALEIATSADYAEIATFDNMRMFPLPNGEMAIPLGPTVIRVPVEHIRTSLRVKGVSFMDGRETYKTRHYYIAIEPKLRELLELPFKLQVDAANEAKWRAKSKLDLFERREAAWWAQPWYLRVWSALRGQR